MVEYASRTTSKLATSLEARKASCRHTSSYDTSCGRGRINERNNPWKKRVQNKMEVGPPDMKAFDTRGKDIYMQTDVPRRARAPGSAAARTARSSPHPESCWTSALLCSHRARNRSDCRRRRGPAERGAPAWPARVRTACTRCWAATDRSGAAGAPRGAPRWRRATCPNPRSPATRPSRRSAAA